METGIHAAREVGALISLLIWVTVLLRTLRGLKDPAVHRLSAQTLLVALGVWGIGLLERFWTLLHPEGLGQIVASLLAVTMASGSLLVLGLGLVALARYEPARYTRGRGQAAAGLAIAALLLFGLTAGLITGQLRQATVPTSAAKPGSTLTQTEHNYEITPGGEWHSLKPEALNAEANLAMTRRRPEMYFLVITESLAGSDLDSYADIVKTNLKAGTEVSAQEQTDETFGTRRFVRLATTTTVAEAKQVLHFEHWLTQQGAEFHQLVIWAANAEANKVKTEARKLAETFKVLDETRVAQTGTPATAVDDPARGFAVDLKGLDFYVPDAPDKPLFAYQATRGIERLVVLPLRFEQGTPSMQALARAFGAQLDLPAETMRNAAQQEWATPLGEGIEFADLRSDGQRYHLRVVRAAKAAWLVAYSAPLAGFKDAAPVLERVTLKAPTGKQPPNSDGARVDLSLVENQTGLQYYEEQDYAEAATWFRRSLKTDANDPVVTSNLCGALRQGKVKPATALAELAPLRASLPKALDLGRCVAQLEMAAGRHEAAQKTFRQLITDGYKDEDELLEWIDLCVDSNQEQACEATVEHWVASHGGVDPQRWLANLISRRDAMGGVMRLAQLSKEHPDNKAVSYNFGEALNRAERPKQAERVARELLKKDAKDTRALVMLGYAQMYQDQDQAAKQSFEQALAADPDYENAQEGLAEASARLGQGENAAAKTPIEPVPLPELVSKSLAAWPQDAQLGEGHGAYALTRSTGYYYKPGEALRRTERRRFRITSAEEARDLSTLRFAVDPLVERVYVNRAQVLDAGGKLLAEAKRGDSFLTEDDGEMADTSRTLSQPLPGVKPGVIVEYEVTWQNLNASTRFPFTRDTFVFSLPTGVKAAYVSGEVAGIKTRLAQANGVLRLAAPDLLAWVVGPLAPSVSEPYNALYEDHYPMLWLGGDEGDWAVVAQDYWKQIGDLLPTDPSIQSLAAELTKDAKNDRAKIAALTAYVQKEVRYKAIEFGVRARRPDAPKKVLAQHYGDCKDHSLLLWQLLRAVNIPAEMALISTQWRTQTALPTMDQFNHMVVWTPALGGNWLLDATNKYLDAAITPAEGLWQSHALLLGDTPRLLAPQPQGPSRVKSERVLTPEGSDWRVRETLTLEGYYAGWMRGAFAGLNTRDRFDKAQGILAAQGVADLRAFEFAEAEASSGPARVVFDYRVRNALQRKNGQVEARLPSPFEHEYLSVAYLPARQFDVLSTYPLAIDSTVQLSLPEKARLVDVQNLAAASPYGQWKYEAREKSLSLSFSTPAFTAPRSQWDAVRESREALLRALEQPIAWTE